LEPEILLKTESWWKPLPLSGQGTLEKPLEWVGLWESHARSGPAVFLEGSGGVEDGNQWRILAGNPEWEYFGSLDRPLIRDSAGVRESPVGFWDFIDRVGCKAPTPAAPPLGLAGAWFGVLSYDLGRKIHLRNREINAAARPSCPDFYFFKPGFLLVCERASKNFWLFGRESGTTPAGPMPFRTGPVRARMDSAAYEAMVRRAQDYISRGDIYQANLSQTFTAQWGGSPGSLYRTLREMNPGPFMGLFQGRGFTVLSSSPERLVAGRGDWLETRPIAGTRPRAQTEFEDLQRRVQLKTNEKEQAEHLMLVDLARNDLGRVSRYGSVRVDRYADLESYASVHHLVSTVRSLRREEAATSAVLKSLFPGGTITGCPKVRCMEIIGELEKRPRGFYTGAMGYLAPGPCFDWNILIRSFTLHSDGRLEFSAGAGIVADSDPHREYLETLYKVETLARALGTNLLSVP
jgi:anthranilate/para-aminobenzoate synthase component I